MVKLNGLHKPSQVLSAKVILECYSNLNALSPLKHRALICWLDESPQAVGASDDTIRRESSGNEEWSRRTKSNNSFDRSAASLSFIRKARMLG
jgi:hypothetical protein